MFRVHKLRQCSAEKFRFSKLTSDNSHDKSPFDCQSLKCPVKNRKGAKRLILGTGYNFTDNGIDFIFVGYVSRLVDAQAIYYKNHLFTSLKKVCVYGQTNEFPGKISHSLH